MIGAAQVPAVARARPPESSVWSLRRRVIPLIARQEARDTLFGWALYVVAAVAVLAGALLLSNALRAVAESGLEIVSRPFAFPVLMATSLAALYLAGWATLAIARPRDQGALRVLFFAPVDPAGLVAGHALSAVLLYAAFLLITTPVFVALAFLVNLPFPPLLLAGIIVSPLFVLPAIGIGLFVSALAPSARSAIFLFAAILAGLIVVQVGYGALMQVPPTTRYYDALLFLREVLRVVREALQWLSPLALLSEGLDAAVRADWRDLAMHAAAGVGGGLVWLALATWALNRRGVLP
jgi:hypothetical protein